MGPLVATPLLSDLLPRSGQVPSTSVRGRPDLADVDSGDSGAGLPLLGLDGPAGRHRLVQAVGGEACESDGFPAVRAPDVRARVASHGVPEPEETMLRRVAVCFHPPESDEERALAPTPHEAARPETLGLVGWSRRGVAAVGSHAHRRTAASHGSPCPPPELAYGQPSPEDLATTPVLRGDGALSGSGPPVQLNRPVPNAVTIDFHDQAETGAVARLAAKMNYGRYKWLLNLYWLLLVVLTMSLNNNLSRDGEGPGPALAMLAGLLCGICLLLRTVKQMM